MASPFKLICLVFNAKHWATFCLKCAKLIYLPCHVTRHRHNITSSIFHIWSANLVCVFVWHVFNRPRKGGITVAPRRAVGTCSPSAAPTVPAACPRTRPSRSLSSGTSWRLRQWGTSPRPASSTVSVSPVPPLWIFVLCHLNADSHLSILCTLQLMFCPSCTWSCTIVSAAPSTAKLWGTALVRPGKTEPPHLGSGLL